MKWPRLEESDHLSDITAGTSALPIQRTTRPIFCRYLNAIHQGLELTLAGAVSQSLPIEPPKQMADGAQNLTLPSLCAMHAEPWHELPDLGMVRPAYPSMQTQTHIPSAGGRSVVALSVMSHPHFPPGLKLDLVTAHSSTSYSKWCFELGETGGE